MFGVRFCPGSRACLHDCRSRNVHQRPLAHYRSIPINYRIHRIETMDFRRQKSQIFVWVFWQNYGPQNIKGEENSTVDRSRSPRYLFHAGAVENRSINLKELSTGRSNRSLAVSLAPNSAPNSEPTSDPSSTPNLVPKLAPISVSNSTPISASISLAP